jgi:hypothetical protein
MTIAAGVAIWVFLMFCVLALFSANGKDEDE